MKRYFREVKRSIFRNWFWIVLGLVLTKKSVECAYQTRGYVAIGGEYLVLPLILSTVSLVRGFVHLIVEIDNDDIGERVTGKDNHDLKK